MTDIIKGLGYGYKSVKNIICMIRCFKCGRENYVVIVSTGKCAFCGYDANAKEEL
jgi:ribosomal protein L37E